MRGFLCFALLAVGCALAADPPTNSSQTLTGKLVVTAGKPTEMELADHKLIQLDGDETMRKILGDQRLNGLQVQAKGQATFPGKFFLDPFHTRPLMVVKDGKLKMITYWCPTCHLRSFVPGPCVCCYGPTDLDLIDPDSL